MSILLLPIGIACVAAALYHGYLGQTRLIGPTVFANRQAKELVAMIWQFSTATWAFCGVVIAVSPWLFAGGNRLSAIVCACLPIMWGVIDNAWVTRGRHFGWKVFAAIVAAAVGTALLAN